MESGRIACLTEVPIFQELKPEELAVIASNTYEKCYKKNDFILRAGEERRHLYFVQCGAVKITKILEDGYEQIIETMHAGDLCGISTLFQEEPLSINIIALQATKVFTIDGELLKPILYRSPATLMKLTVHMTKQIQQLEDRLSAMTHKDVKSRIALYLLEQQQKRGSSFKLAMNQKDLACLLSTSRESLSRKLAEMQKQQLILHKNQLITIINANKLRAIAVE